MVLRDPVNAACLRAYVLVCETGTEQDNLHMIRIISGGDRSQEEKTE